LAGWSLGTICAEPEIINKHKQKKNDIFFFVMAVGLRFKKWYGKG